VTPSEQELTDVLSPRRRTKNRWPSTIPRLECLDGFYLSVQASAGHYCEPRNDLGPWTSLEVAYPNRIEPLLWPYVEIGSQSQAWLDSVYPFVPFALVAAVIELHGGLSSPLSVK